MAAYDEVFEELKRGIQTLPEDEAQILQLYYVEDFNWRQISMVTKKAPTVVSALYWSAIEKLKPKLREFAA